MFAVAEVRCAFESAPPTPTPARPARESAPIARHGRVVVAPTAAVAPARADREALPAACLFSKEPIGREHVVGESRKETAGAPIPKTLQWGSFRLSSPVNRRAQVDGRIGPETIGICPARGASRHTS